MQLRRNAIKKMKQRISRLFFDWPFQINFAISTKSIRAYFSKKKIEIVIQIEIENFANLNCAKGFGNNFVTFYGNFHYLFAMILKHQIQKNDSKKASNAKCDKKDVKKLARKFSSTKSF